MRDIQQEITQLGAQHQTCVNEIKEKKEEISKLQAVNARLNEQNLGKERKNPSINVNRKRINLLNDQVQELNLVLRNLEQSLKFSQEKQVEVSHQSKVNAYKKAEASHLQSYAFVQECFNQLLAAIGKLEKLQAGHCLARLAELTAALGTEQMESLGVNVNATMQKFAAAQLSTDFDGSKIARINLNTANLLNQLKAVKEGKRVYSKVKQAPHPQTAPKVSRAQYAKQLEEYRLRDMDALKRAKEHRQVIHHQPHK